MTDAMRELLDRIRNEVLEPDLDENECEQLLMYLDAFAIFKEREAKYHSLWKQYGAIDSLHHMGSKLARCEQSLEVATFRPGGSSKEIELSPGRFDEGDAMDLINYTVFFVRNMRAGRKHNSVERRTGSIVIAVSEEIIPAGTNIEINLETGRARIAGG